MTRDAYYDTQTDLQALHKLGREAGERDQQRIAPRGLLYDEGAAWYRGYDEAAAPP